MNRYDSATNAALMTMIGLLFFAKPTQMAMEAGIIDAGIARNSQKTIRVLTVSPPANSIGANRAANPQIRNAPRAAS